MLIDATAGIEVGTEIVWRLASDLNRPRLLVVSRVDRDNADTASVVDDLRERFGANVAPIQVPIGDGPDFRGVVDLLDGKARIFGENGSSVAETPDDLAETVEDAREQLVEAVASTDDELLEQYLEGEELQRSDLERALRAGIAEGSIYPVLFSAATDLKGVREVMEALVTLAPSPTEGLAAMLDGNAPPIDGPVVAQVFKTLADPFVGKVSMFRLFAGQIDGDAQTSGPAHRTDRTPGQHPVRDGQGRDPGPADIRGRHWVRNQARWGNDRRHADRGFPSNQPAGVCHAPTAIRGLDHS